MKIVPEFEDHYYWARDPDGSTFVVKREKGLFYVCGKREPVNDEFDPDRQIIKPIADPVH